MVTNSTSAETAEERAVKMLNEAISLLTTSQYVVNYFMAHIDFGQTTAASEMRKLKRDIVEFLNAVQPE